MFRINTIIYFAFTSILVVFLIFTAKTVIVHKLSININERLVEFKKSGKDTTQSIAGTPCQPLHYIPDAESRPVTALASYPGSGNTWLRYLIQQSTGILTGSEGKDNDLLSMGFPADGVFNASVAVVKTHERLNKIEVQYQKAVLLIRHPKPAIQATFNLYNSPGHTGCANDEAYDSFFGLYWNYFVKWNILDWQKMNIDWIQNFKGPLHIVLYEDLRNDLGLTLRSLVQFLDLPLNETAIQCTVENSEGLYHRKPCLEEIDHFTKEMNENIVAVETYVFEEMDKRDQSKI